MMRYLSMIPALALLCWTFGAHATLFRPDPEPPLTLTCNDTGTATLSLPEGTYELLVSEGDAALCYAATCPTGGATRVPGNHGLILNRYTTPVSCRSVGPSKVQFVKGTALR